MKGWINATVTIRAPIINRGDSWMISTEKKDHVDGLFGMKSFIEVATTSSTVERKSKEVEVYRNKYYMTGWLRESINYTRKAYQNTFAVVWANV